jgi:hypothetical protein
VDAGTALAPPAQDKPEWLTKNVSEDSPIRLAALKIMAMRKAGVADAEIAKALGLSEKTLPGYLYKAGKMGWLTFDDPKDALEYQILHKAVKRLDEGLDDETRNEKTGMPVQTVVALRIAEGTVFKKFDQANTLVGPMTAISIKIEQPMAGQVTVLDEEAGTPAYIDGETVK